eukprot:3621555-Pleurochrysis_carterae.AAC.1
MQCLSDAATVACKHHSRVAKYPFDNFKLAEQRCRRAQLKDQQCHNDRFDRIPCGVENASRELLRSFSGADVAKISTLRARLFWT